MQHGPKQGRTDINYFPRFVLGISCLAVFPIITQKGNHLLFKFLSFFYYQLAKKKIIQKLENRAKLLAPTFSHHHTAA